MLSVAVVMTLENELPFCKAKETIQGVEVFMLNANIRLIGSSPYTVAGQKSKVKEQYTHICLCTERVPAILSAQENFGV